MSVVTHYDSDTSGCFRITRQGKAIKNIVSVLFAVVIIFIALGFIMPWMGRMRANTERLWRIAKLQGWHKKVELFVRTNNRLPESFFEMCQEDLEQGIWSFPIPFVSEDQKPFGELTPSLTTDPNRFLEIVEYGLFSGQNGWFIRELKHGKIYTKMLMIDQEGKIFEVKEVQKEKYSNP